MRGFVSRHEYVHVHSLTTAQLHDLHAAHLQIPYFNAPIFLENKTQIGKVEEILGSLNNVVRSSSCVYV